MGTPIEIADVTYSYTQNGKIRQVVDANGNRAELRYDGHDRQTRWVFPSKTRPAGFNPSTAASALVTAGALNESDYEAYTYDANGNRTSLRKRDNSIIAYQYDALNRMIVKDLPVRGDLHATHRRDVYYGYDLRGLQTYARFESPSGIGVTYTYDGFGRLSSETQSSDGNPRTVSSQYDANGNRTRVTWPDGGRVDYSYDAAGRFTQAAWRDATFGVNVPFAGALYNARGLPSSFSLASAGTSFGYDAVGRLSNMMQDFVGTAADVGWGYTRNPASQILSEIQSNDSYAWNGFTNLTRPYTTNGLNQYQTAGSAAFCYDANGNLTADGTNVYLYDIENRLVQRRQQVNTNCAALNYGGAPLAELHYDPLGRLYQINGGASRILYDGNAMLGEYNSGGALFRRYVHGPNGEADDAWVQFEGTTMDCPATRFYHTDPRGSVIALADCWGNNQAINSYDEYGIPDAATGNDIATKGRFRYTGQAWIPELGMYYYKARIYSPTLGRFLQTDPIGYEDQFNLYAYVGNDPVNRSDPTGLAGCAKGMSEADCGVAMAAQTQARAAIKETQTALKGLTNERAAVASGDRKELSAGAKATEAALNKHFGDSGASTIKSVQSSLSGIDKILADDGKKYNFTREDIGNYFGRANPFSDIKLGNPFFSTNFRNQVVTVLHEPFHVMGHIYLPESYEGANRGWPTWYHLLNADDIARFAWERGK